MLEYTLDAAEELLVKNSNNAAENTIQVCFMLYI